MKLKILYTLFVVLGIAGCGFAYFEMPIEAIVFRSLYLLVLLLVYYTHKRFDNFFFYLGILVSGIGEALLVLGFENYITPVILCFATYAWLLIFMIKKEGVIFTYRIDKGKLASIFISVCIVLYLLINILELITPKLGDSLCYGYFFIVSFFVMAIYMGIVYLGSNSSRYIWLFLFTFIVVISIAITSLEAFYFPSKLFSQIGFLTQIGSHFFLLNFFITKDSQIKF